MSLRVISRTDVLLAGALVAAAVITFHHPLNSLLATVAEIEAQYDLSFLPALTLLSIVFAFTQYRKRSDAATEARLASARSEELERLLMFGNSLANALDEGALGRALCRQMPGFVGDRAYWVLARQEQGWIEIAQERGATAERSPDELEQLATQAVLGAALPGADRQGISLKEDVCVPLVVAGTIVGVLGVRDTPPLSVHERSATTAMAAVLALALRNLQVLEESRRLGTIDGLTGCLNRAAGVENLESELRRAKRSFRPLSILLLDIDHFKNINDTDGHLAGDAVLEQVGHLFAKVLRTTDKRCRVGGDEFMIILPETAVDGAQLVAAKIHAAKIRATKGTGAAAGDGVTPQVTFSIGITGSEPGEMDPAALIGRADAALYLAKRAGRNTTCVAPAERDGGHERPAAAALATARSHAELAPASPSRVA